MPVDAIGGHSRRPPERHRQRRPDIRKQPEAADSAGGSVGGRVAAVDESLSQSPTPELAELRWTRRPRLERPVVLAAFRGWNDAGDAATSAAKHLAQQWRTTAFAELDPEEFFDFTVARRVGGNRPPQRRRRDAGLAARHAQPADHSAGALVARAPQPHPTVHPPTVG